VDEMKTKVGIIVLAATMLVARAQAESITHGASTINMDFVNIGYAGNVADVSGYGAVAENFRIAKYEVTIAEFATALAADGRIGNGNENYWNTAGIDPSMGHSTLIGANAPATYTTWQEAVKFCNWLTTGDAYNGAYKHDSSGVFTAIDRDAAISAYGTVYVLPTLDERTKAAFFKSDGSGYTLYASGDSRPTVGYGGENYRYYNDFSVYPWGEPIYPDTAIGATWTVGSGIEENNGTYDMNGNVGEWTETKDSSSGNRFSDLGGYMSSDTNLKTAAGFFISSHEYADLGFRVAAIPEPSSIAMIGLAGGFVVFGRRIFTV
jgi:sulfatase modifying factor 1